jgi:hypothetical protein
VETIIYINNQQEDCVGVAPQKCMQIKYHPTEDWQYFYENIQGFNFESGFFYKLKVDIQNVEKPAADTSSKKYILIEIIEKSQFEIE